jgi:tyrosyl-DNA phosphodiesterase-1
LRPGSTSDIGFQRAITLSLQEAAWAEASPILISDDEGDEDAEFKRELRRAIEVSKAEGSTPTARGDSSKSAQQQAQDMEPVTSTFLSERALMEKQRLERQKRLRSDTSFDEKDESSKRQHLSSISEARPNGKAKASLAASGSSGSSSTLNVPTIDQVFWEGEARQVANRHAEPRKDGRPTFRLTDVLGKVCFSPSMLCRFSRDESFLNRNRISRSRYCRLIP